MSIELELETDVETEVEPETTKKNRVEPSLIDNRMMVLLMKRDNPDQGTKDLTRLMALVDPYRS